MVGVGLNSSGEFNRENQRNFVVSETFQKLLENPIHGCAEEPLPTENFAYPIAGIVGMEELISTFIDLNENETLTAITAEAASSSKSSPDTSSTGTKQQPSTTPGSSSTPMKMASSKGSGMPAVGSGVFSDQLMFTTTLTGGVTPSVQINPIGRQWGLATGTNFAATVTRTDHHNLQIGLSLATPGETKLIAGLAAGPVGPRMAVLVTSGALAPSALQKHRNQVSPAEQRALDAMTQQRIDNFLNRFGTVVAAQ
jgi:hypothetical protein